MATIESYNASYPLSYYQIGNVYSFYGTKNAKMAEPATDEQIRKYSNKLIELEQERTNSAIKPSGNAASCSTVASRFSRYYAVVVQKHSDAKSSGIYVMFINKSEEGQQFLVKKYAVSHPVTFDDVDLMPVSTFASIAGAKADTRTGHLTKVKSDHNAVGQLTRVQENTVPLTKSSGIGQLTRADHSSPAPEETPRVGKLTRSKR